ncbi:MBL fold hydrolase [Haloferula helveola]|uniref:MBL fold hydrolase n=1 Tax=Haloferula helveola TaxID=490095 RepID=A0ABN6HB38_9BACT|nr:MBL fold hydrolase [Haloferula helveola]
MTEIQRFEGGYLLTNSYLAPTPQGGWVMIDAPMEADQWLEQSGIRPTALILTHQHFDHVMTAAAISAMGVPVYAWSPFDRSLTLEEVVREWGMPFDVDAYSVDHTLKGRDTLEIEGLEFRLAHLPGHSPDSVILHQPEAGVVFAGDTLFAGSTGRPDLPGGDMDLLCAGIREKIYTLPPDTRVLPGHGPETTSGTEAATNPICRAF